MRAHAFLLATMVLAGSAGMAPHALAQDVTGSVSPAPQQLEELESAIGASATRQAELETGMREALAAEAELSRKLVVQAKTVTSQEQKLAETAKRMDGLKKKIATLGLQLAEKQDVLSGLLAGLQQLEQNPPPALVVSPDDVLGALRSAILFGAIVPELRHEAEILQGKLAELETLHQSLTAEARSYGETLAALERARGDIRDLIATKKAMALASKLGLEQEKKRAAELAEQAKTLRQLLAGIEADRKKAEEARSEAEKEKLAANERERQRQHPPAIAFSQARGQLAYPAQGLVLKEYGSDSGLGGKLDGLVIATATKAQVTSPVDGKVEFAGPFRSYGHLLIMNPGEGYLVLLAGMDQILAEPGQSIRTGEPVGVMGERPASIAVANGLTSQPSPVLYVEFRKNGDPVDPTPWWAGNRQEATR